MQNMKATLILKQMVEGQLLVIFHVLGIYINKRWISLEVMQPLFQPAGIMLLTPVILEKI